MTATNKLTVGLNQTPVYLISLQAGDSRSPQKQIQTANMAASFQMIQESLTVMKMHEADFTMDSIFRDVQTDVILNTMLTISVQ